MSAQQPEFQAFAGNDAALLVDQFIRTDRRGVGGVFPEKDVGVGDDQIFQRAVHGIARDVERETPESHLKDVHGVGFEIVAAFLGHEPAVAVGQNHMALAGGGLGLGVVADLIRGEQEIAIGQPRVAFENELFRLQIESAFAGGARRLHRRRLGVQGWDRQECQTESEKRAGKPAKKTR